jgi:hypothetical protein
VADVLQIIKARVLRALSRLGVVRLSPEELEVDTDLAAKDPILAQLAAAAVTGVPPAGFAERKRGPVLLGSDGSEIVGDLVVQSGGFNLHAKTRAGGLDEEARARLLRYVLRPPLSQERLQSLPDQRVRLTLKRPWSDGTYALEMDALALLARLAASVPPPRAHVVRYAGVLSSANHWRPLLVPPLPTDATTAPPPSPPTSVPPKKPVSSGLRCRYIKWSELLRLTFGLTVDRCAVCGGRMKLRALVRDPDSIERFLRHQGLWAEPRPLAPARAPPEGRSVHRLTSSRQQQLCFDS